MKIALYKSTNGNWLDGAINAFSGFGGYSHVELVFSDGVSFSSTSRGNDGSCVYANGRPKPDGTRFKNIDYRAHPDRWTQVHLGVGPDAEWLMWQFAQSELDARYDFAGCARFVLPFWKEHKTKWFCSEIVLATLQHGGMLKGHVPHKTSPNRLARLLEVL